MNELLPDISVSAAADDQDKDVAAGDKQNDKITKGNELVYKSKVEEAQKITAIARNLLQNTHESQENILEHDLIKISNHLISNVILDAQTSLAEEKRQQDLIKRSNYKNNITDNIITSLYQILLTFFFSKTCLCIQNNITDNIITYLNQILLTFFFSKTCLCILVSNVILDAQTSLAEEKRQQDLIKRSNYIVSNVILDAQTSLAEEKRQQDLIKISNYIVSNVILDAQTSLAEEKRQQDLIKISNHVASNIILNGINIIFYIFFSF